MPSNSKEYAKKYYKENKHRFKKPMDKKYLREYVLKTKYGITLEEYNRMFNEQQGCCAICNTHQSDLTKALSVDHNHDTGEVRGLLCNRCNVALGYMNDDAKLLLNASQYLHSNTQKGK